MRKILVIIFLLISTISYSQDSLFSTHCYYNEFKTYKEYRHMGRGLELTGLGTAILGIKLSNNNSQINPVLGVSAVVFIFGFILDNYLADKHLHNVIFIKENNITINLD